MIGAYAGLSKASKLGHIFMGKMMLGTELQANTLSPDHIVVLQGGLIVSCKLLGEPVLHVAV